jgi:hypothetical protein
MLKKNAFTSGETFIAHRVREARAAGDVDLSAQGLQLANVRGCSLSRTKQSQTNRGVRVCALQRLDSAGSKTSSGSAAKVGAKQTSSEGAQSKGRTKQNE